MPLPTRPLGSSGVQITTTGFGAWAIGGAGWTYGWGPQDDDASIAAMRHAVERGINWIDTAAVYGLVTSVAPRDGWLATLLLDRGFTQPITLALFFWGLGHALRRIAVSAIAL